MLVCKKSLPLQVCGPQTAAGPQQLCLLLALVWAIPACLSRWTGGAAQGAPHPAVSGVNIFIFLISGKCCWCILWPKKIAIAVRTMHLLLDIIDSVFLPHRLLSSYWLLYVLNFVIMLPLSFNHYFPGDCSSHLVNYMPPPLYHHNCTQLFTIAQPFVLCLLCGKGLLQVFTFSYLISDFS